MYKKNNRFKIRKENEFYLVFDCVNKTYLRLNETAVIIINSAVKCASIDEIVEDVCRETGDDPELAKADIMDAIEKCVELGILVNDQK